MLRYCIYNKMPEQKKHHNSNAVNRAKAKVWTDESEYLKNFRIQNREDPLHESYKAPKWLRGEYTFTSTHEEITLYFD